MQKIIHAGVLPFSHTPTGQIVFLLGQEHPEVGWKDQLTFSDFGGRPEQEDKDTIESAAREGYEESMGLLGNITDIKNNIRMTNYKVFDKVSVLYLIYIPFNPYLPAIYQNIYNYANTCMKLTDTKKPIMPSCPKGYYEKINIKWFTPKQIIKYEKNIRPIFYRFFIKELYSQDWVF